MKWGFQCTKNFERYYYESLMDLKAHMLYMKRKGYRVWEYDQHDLWAEYEMNEMITGSVEVDNKTDLDFIGE